MNESPMAAGLATRDRPLILHDLLEEIAWLEAGRAHFAEVERLVEEFRRLRREL